jgi:hypothetical protein
MPSTRGACGSTPTAGSRPAATKRPPRCSPTWWPPSAPCAPSAPAPPGRTRPSDPGHDCFDRGSARADEPS